MTLLIDHKNDPPMGEMGIAGTVTKCCVEMALFACWICNAVYIWCLVDVAYAVLCTYGVVCMLYIWCYVHVVLCACGVVYILYMGCCVQVVLCTCRECSVVYMWCCEHVLHAVLCTHCAGGYVYMW